MNLEHFNWLMEKNHYLECSLCNHVHSLDETFIAYINNEDKIKGTLCLETCADYGNQTPVANGGYLVLTRTLDGYVSPVDKELIIEYN